MNSEQRENMPEGLEVGAETTHEVPAEQGLVDILISLLQQRVDQVQGVIERFPSRMKTLEKELTDLKRTIGDFKSQISGKPNSKID